jgi:signal peptidase II
MQARVRLMVLVLLIGASAGCDQATKWAARSQLEGQAPRTVVAGLVDLRYHENTDSAFNLLRWMSPDARRGLLLVVGAMAMVAGVVVWRRHRRGRWDDVAAVLILGGAIGNWVDRALHGHVVDFIHLRHWPVFNVADVFVVLGVLVLLGVGWRSRPRPLAT